MLLPLLVAVTIAHGFTVLALRRSILTEKVARRGYHLSREYAVDPLEILFVREVMRTSIVTLRASSPLPTLAEALRVDPAKGPQRLYPDRRRGWSICSASCRVWSCRRWSIKVHRMRRRRSRRSRG